MTLHVAERTLGAVPVPNASVNNESYFITGNSNDCIIYQG